MYYSALAKGFFLNATDRDDCVEITSDQHSQLLTAQSNGKVITSDEQGYPISIDPSPPSLEELRENMNVTAFQAKAALARVGMYENVVALMNSTETPFEVKLAWNEVLTFKRLSPTVLTLGAALQLDDEALDNLFELAATIDA